MAESKRVKLVVIVAWIGLVGAIIGLGVWRLSFDETIRAIAADKSPQLAAINLYFAKLQSIGNLSLGLIGVLWAFVIYEEKTKLEINTAWRSALLYCATTFLLFSFALYMHGYDFLVGRLFFHSAFDFEAPIVRFYSVGQMVFFGGGTLSFLMIVFCCRKQRGTQHDEN